MSVFSWVARHTRAVQLGSLAAALVLLVGGMWLGMSQAAGSPAPPAPGCSDCPRPQPETPTKHYVVGTVADLLAPNRAILRTNAGRFVVVESDASTLVRKKAGIAGLRRGTRVIILGTPKDGRFHAEIVTITGQAPARAEPQLAPQPNRAPGRAGGAARPVPATHARPTPAVRAPAPATAVPTKPPAPAQPPRTQAPVVTTAVLAASDGAAAAPAVRATPAATAVARHVTASERPALAATEAPITKAVASPSTAAVSKSHGLADLSPREATRPLPTSAPEVETKHPASSVTVHRARVQPTVPPSFTTLDGLRLSR